MVLPGRVPALLDGVRVLGLGKGVAERLQIID